MFLLKAFYWGQQGARDNFSLQIRNIIESGYRSLGEKPVIIGETGIPMDMKYVLQLGPILLTYTLHPRSKKEAFTSDDFSWQAKMMDAVLTALERSLIGFT